WIFEGTYMRKAGAIVGSVCTLGALVLILSEWLATSPLQAGASSEPQIKLQKEPLSRDVLARTSFAPVIKKVGPSVVTIYSTKMVRTTGRSPLFDDPFFRRFFGLEEDEEDPQQQPPPQQQPRRRGQGQG